MPPVQGRKERLETPSPTIGGAPGLSAPGHLGKQSPYRRSPTILAGEKASPQEHLERGNEDPRRWTSGGAKT